MPKDIRSFFKVIPKGTVGTSHEPKKKKLRLIDSDEEDVIEVTPQRIKNDKKSFKSTIILDSDDETPKKSKKSKSIEKQEPKLKSVNLDDVFGDKSIKQVKSIVISDSDDDSPKKNKKSKPIEKQEPKLKSVNLDDVFGDKPIKQAKVEHKPKKEEPQQNEKKKDKSRKKIITEIGVHQDKDFEKTLLDLDDDLLTSNLDVLDKTIEEALATTKDDEKRKKSDDISLSKSVTQESKSKASKATKRSITSSEGEGSTPKKIKLDHVDSGIDPDQEAFERKRYSAMLYQKYKNRGGPKMHGQKEPPKGNANCLHGLTFLRTGVLDSLESEEFENMVAEYGGRCVKAVSKKVNYLVVGDDPGPSKLEKASNLGIPEINEDQFFDLILTKSGKEPKYAQKTKDSQDSGFEFENKLEEVPDSPVRIKLSPKKSKDKSNKEALKTEPVKTLLKKSEDEKPVKIKNNQEKQKELKKPIEAESQIKSLDPKILNDETKTVSKEIKPKPQNDNNVDVKDPNNHEKSEISSLANALSWTEKYKPKDTTGIIGQKNADSNVARLKFWLSNWEKNQLPEVKEKLRRPSPWAVKDDGAFFKAALLSGPPGVGKTTTATLVTKEMGYDVVEFNASDTRSKKLLQEEVSQLLNTTSVIGFAKGREKLYKRRVLLMDEVDGMAGNEDRGGMQELINLIKTSKMPIICMCNDRNHQKMKSLLNYCFELRFSPPKMEQIRGAMMSICFKEGVKIPPNILSEIIMGTGCDIRQTLNNLTMYAALNKDINMEEAVKKSKDSKKDTVLGPWEVVRLVFTETEHKQTLVDKTKLFFYDYSLGPLFVQENYLGVTPNCPKKQALKRAALAADAISRGDLVDAKIRSTNSWALLESQAIYSSVLPGFYMSGKITSRINFPSWLGKNSSRNKKKRLLSEIHAHTRTSTSGSIEALKLDYLVPLRNAIITPLIKEGSHGIQKAVKVMHDYNLLKDDLNNILELCQWKDTSNPFNAVNPTVKSAFTRAYNKSAQMLPFATGTGFSKKKHSYYDEDEDADNLSDPDDEGDDLKNDTLIKVKSKTKDEAESSTKTTSKKGKGSKKPSTNKGKNKK